MNEKYFLVIYNDDDIIYSKEKPYSSTQTAIQIAEKSFFIRELFFYKCQLDDLEIEYYMSSLRSFDQWICFCPKSLSTIKNSLTDITLKSYKKEIPQKILNTTDEDIMAINKFSEIEIKKLTKEKGSLLSITQFEFDYPDNDDRILKTTIYEVMPTTIQSLKGKKDKIRELYENFKTATIVKLGTNIEWISKEGNGFYDSQLKDPIFIHCLRDINTFSVDCFGGKVQGIFAFTTNKATTILFENNDKYIIINPIARDQDLVTLDFILNYIYCNDNPNIIFNIEESIIFIIINNKIERNSKFAFKYNEQEITKLYWLRLRIIDLQLSGIMSTSKNITKITSYCLVYNDILVYFKSDSTKGRMIYIIDYPKNTLLPLSDLGRL